MPTVEPILITGVPRSGTSLVANVIHHCGAGGGLVHTNGGPGNPTGLYENQAIIDRVNKEILWNLGCDPRGQEKLPDHNIPRIDISIEIHTIIQGQGGSITKPWYFKDPKTLLVYGSYLKSFPGAKWILVRRNIDDIIDSCIRASFLCNKDSVVACENYVKHYLALAEKLQAECPNVLEVWYDKIMDGNLDELGKVIEWLGLEFIPEYIDKTVIHK